jgi:hypothetical protein
VLIGVCGKKRAGKDTVGLFLKIHHKFRMIALADPIREIAIELFGLNKAQLDGDLKEKVDVRWGLTPRGIMQKLGTEVGREGRFAIFEPMVSATQLRAVFAKHKLKAGSTCWIDSLFARIAEQKFFLDVHDFVVTDVRFPNEAEAIKKNGGKLVFITRPALPVSMDVHASEAEIDNIDPDLVDFHLINDGTLKQLHARVGITLNQFRSRR